MDKEQLSTFFSIALGIITPFIATPVVYLWYFNESSVSLILLIPFTIILTFITMCLTGINLKNSWKWPLFGNLLFPVLTAIFSVACIGSKILKDSPTVMVQAGFYNREGFEIFLREDMTVKAIETTMISSNEKYGRYKISGDTVFLSGINIEYRKGV